MIMEICSPPYGRLLLLGDKLTALCPSMEIVAHWKKKAAASITSHGGGGGGVGNNNKPRLVLYRRKTLVLKTSCSSSIMLCAAVALACLLVLAVCLLLYLPEPFFTQNLVFTTTDDDDKMVTLLIWTHPFSRYRKPPDCEALYKIRGCAVTDDWRAYPRADAVVVHHREVVAGNLSLPPEPRPRTQKWIWMNFESPSHTRGLARLEGVFNLTMTYRTDSDIFLPYGYLVPLPRGLEGVTQRSGGPVVVERGSHLIRPHLAAWVISNWSESHARVAFYYQLSLYIDVDVFGRAGLPLPDEDRGSGSVVRLIRRYQFYLALENSQHTDYITEKLWHALRAGAIPVVLGPSRENYERFLPPEAFIHVDDFPTVRGLARYLLLLRRSPARLQRHLEWRKNYAVHQPAFWAEQYCTACRAVRKARDRTYVVTDLTAWFQS